MQLGDRTIYSSEQIRITDKELTLLYEIGLNYIPTATDFVSFFSGKYQLSQSGVWYTLKKLKKEGVLDFTEKGEDQRPLALTAVGMHMLRNRTVNVQDRQYHDVHVAHV